MNDYLSILRKDFDNIIDYFIDNKIINNSFNKSNVNLDFNSKSKQGDISSNIYILISKSLIKNEYNLKKDLIFYIEKIDYIEKVEIAKIGFVNIFLKKDFIINNLNTILTNKNNFGESNFGKGKKVNIEFVSANPTGPIHVAHMRGAVFGDVLSNMMKSIGYNVTKEYYVNDAGSQIKILGKSLFKRYQQLNDINININDDEYPGDYLIGIAKKILKKDGNKWLSENENLRLNYFENYSINEILEVIKKDLASIDISFDNYINESNIVKENYIEKVFEILKEKNLLYEGVLEKPKGDDLVDWEPRKQLLFKSSQFLDDSDRPFKKANGEWTYFANDSAYHYFKFLRSYDEIINIWGSDHIGYIKRMKSIVDVISNKKNYLNILTCQIVRLLKDKKILKMSKREGNFITLKDILNEVGKDPLRFFMISTKNETPMDFDLNKVIEKNRDNPVFYCQYAYARASSVINKAIKIKYFKNFLENKNSINFKYLSEYEWEIILKLISWPYILHQSTILKQPHRIINYIENLSTSFHSFWNRGKDNESLRFIDEKNIEKTLTKLLWIESMRIVYKKVFEVIGIDAPETM